MEHPEGTDTARIIQLAQSFPSIANLEAVVDWEPETLDRWAASVASHGERLAVQFVLAVWNQHETWDSGKFDVLDAYGTWDQQHWAAFQYWVGAPYTL